MGLFPGFADKRLAVNGVEIQAVVGGSGPPLLLLHGAPQSHVMWHHIAPRLAERFTVVATDLRGYGDSSKPPGGGDHADYSFRTMTADQVAVMKQLGHNSFSVVAHDRGARVTHRMLLDHPEAVTRAALLDIVPTKYVYDHTDRALATAYFHWFFFIQPAPLPETLITASPDFFLKTKMASQTKSGTLEAIDSRALQHYLAPFRDPSRVHAMCEDYRAGAYADYEIDKADVAAGKKITIPMLALWGDAGIASVAATPLDTWKQWATNVRGSPVDSGHFLAEENPDETARLLRAFFLEG